MGSRPAGSTSWTLGAGFGREDRKWAVPAGEWRSDVRVQLQQRHSEQLETCGPEHEQLQRRILLTVSVRTAIIIIIISNYSLAAAAPRALRRCESWEQPAARGARPLPSGPLWRERCSRSPSPAARCSSSCCRSGFRPTGRR